MASSSTNPSVPYSSSTHPRKYDVFLSFRGEDTRQSFTAHLQAALCRKGINTFKDNLLRRGEKISPALLQGIEESRFSIIIFSENYASSSWCLDELTKILESVKEGGLTALPVFHNVDPSNVKKQKGSFEEAFAKHEQVYGEKMEKVIKWRKALTEAATISGWDSRNRDESEVIEEIVTRILNERIDASSNIKDALVGMDSRMEDMISLLCIGSIDVRTVGIWGMAGIGKTTIAEAVYDKIYTKFEGCCFLRNVREDSKTHGLTYLKEKLLLQILGGETRIFDTGIDFIKARLHSRKVLIVLDDVDNQHQLEALAGNHDWFGLGSRIIITTRAQHLLIVQDVGALIYEAKELEYDEALKLFHQHAFKHKHPTEDFVQLCGHALNYTKGIPLALKILGRFLYNRSKKEWKNEFEKLKRVPNREVQEVLKISYDGLDDNQKDIFLDIACFFKGQDKDNVAKILKSCDFYPEIGINVLMEKALINVLENKLCMHDLLQEMGWEIVRQESVKSPGKRSRLWAHEDVNYVLTTETGTKAVEGIVLDLSSSKDQLRFNVDAITKMDRLRVLRFYNREMDGSLEYLSRKEAMASTHGVWRWREYEMCNKLYTDCELYLSGDFKFLSNNLRSLCWLGYPLKSLPSNFHPEKLVELNLCSSQLKQLWEGNKRLEKLKFIKLSHSQHLIKTPDFSGAPNLRRLILEGCTSLVEIHPSIGAHKKLIFLNLEGCKKVKSFSSSIHMQSLKILNLSGCFKLKKFPELLENMEHLPELSLEGTAVKELPSSLEYLTGLALLNLRECKTLELLPSSIFKLKSLKTLVLSNCSRLKKLPDILENLESLKELFLDGSGIRELPSSIGRLNGLVLLNLRNCKKLSSLPQSICGLTTLQTLILSGCLELKELPVDLRSLQCLAQLNADGSGIREVPPSIILLTNLQELSLAGCRGGESKSRSWVFPFHSSPTQGLRLPYLSGLYSLKVLNLRRCNLSEGALPTDIGYLPSLEWLDLSSNSFITIPASLSGISGLKTLIIECCESLRSLPELPSSIERLNAYNCTSLETFSCSSSAYTSKKWRDLRFNFANCFRLGENQGSDIVGAILEGIQLMSSIPKFLVPDQGIPTPHNGYNAFVPGSRIPEWFTHQSVGCSVNIELPPHWYITSSMGLAFCVVFNSKFSFDEYPVTEPPPFGSVCSLNQHCFVHSFVTPTTSYVAPEGPRFIESDHMFFGYQSLAELALWEDKWLRELSGNVVASFRFIGPDIELKKCGFRLVYEEGEEDSGCIFPSGTMFPGDGDGNDSNYKVESGGLLTDDSDSWSPPILDCRWRLPSPMLSLDESEVIEEIVTRILNE